MFPQKRRLFPILYPILDAELVFRAAPFDPASDMQARRALLRALTAGLQRAGVEIMQYRNKCDKDAIVAEDALAIREAARSMRLILNDRPAVAASAGWDGVHLGQDDLSPEQARAMLGDGAIIGLSTHNNEQVIQADRQPVDYIATGPVFSTLSKSDLSPVIGLDGVRAARSLTARPLVAIGGISLQSAASVCDAGADSLAVISAIFGPGRSPERSAKDFLEIFK